jgi:tetratricopeptide (TPR) repeat protein
MDDRAKRATDLGTAALDLASQGRMIEARTAYRDAIELAAACDHHSLPDYHVQLGVVLGRLGDRDDALVHFEQGLSEALRQHDKDESSASVGIVRYFMANFLVSIGRSADALQVLAPAIGHAQSIETVLRLVEAEALWSLNQHEAARRAADRGLALAKTDEQRARMTARLSQLSGWTGAS